MGEMARDHRLKPDQRVRLKSNGEDGVYPFACAGNEGWVRATKHDEVGWPLVFIEWDKDHWSYNGEKDQWTMEDHFDPVGESMPEGFDKEGFTTALRALAVSAGVDLGESPQEPAEAATEAEAQASEDARGYDTQEDLALKLKAALAAADQMAGFLLIAVTKQDHPGLPDPILVPHIVNSYSDAVTAVAVELQLSKLAHISHQDFATAVLQSEAE